jgi:serine protease Do
LTDRRGVGSGFIIDPTGYVVTNSHVVGESTEMELRVSDGTKFTARLVGRDEATDIALMKVDAPRQFPSVRLADDSKVRVGDWVLAVGNPFGLGGTVTAGIVSARGRDEVGKGQYTDYFQLDAAINPGNSGGPTFDMSGRVMGMNTLGGSGIGFAIPASTIRRVVGDLKATGKVSRGYLGVQIGSLSDDDAKSLGLASNDGAIVTEVIEGSPAQAAGIKRGDVILKVDGQPVRDSRELSRRITALQAGQKATFTIWREGKQITITVTVARRAQLASTDFRPALTSLGLGLMSLTSDLRGVLNMSADTSGVLIVDVAPGSDAAENGLKAGDRIVAVGSAAVTSLTDINLAVEQAKALNRPSVLLFVVTKRGTKAHVSVKLTKG